MSSWTPDISPGRREAIGRAARAMIGLAFIPELRAETHYQLGIVAAVTAYDDHDAATAVAALEHMLIDRGLMTPEQVEADVLVHRTTRGARAAVNSKQPAPPGCSQ